MYENKKSNIKLKKKEERKKNEGGGNSTELQKPNVEAEVYNSNKKCDWGTKTLKSLIRFHGANKTNNRGWKQKKNPKESTEQVKTESTEQVKHKSNRRFPWLTAVRVLSLAESHSPTHLPRTPSNTVLISRPAAGAAKILIWPYSCVFLPPMSTAIRNSTFSFTGALKILLYSP